MNRDDTNPGPDDYAAPPVGERIRRRREQLRMAAKDLAERVGISPSYLSLIERQGRVPSPEVAEALAHELGDDVDLYVVWARSKGVEDLGTYARRIDRLARWSTDPGADGRVVSGEDLDEDPPSTLADDPAPPTRSRPREPMLGSVRARMSRYLSAHDEPAFGRAEEPDLVAHLEAPLLSVTPESSGSPIEPRPDPDLVRVPVYPNGADPEDTPEPLEVLDLDRRLIPPDAEDLFAYRPDVRSARRIRDLIRPGDLVVLSSRPGPFGSNGVHAVRYEGRIVLTRAAVKSGTLAMLPGPGAPSSIEWIPLRIEPGSTADAVARVVAGSVVATLRWWGGSRYPRDYDRRPKPR